MVKRSADGGGKVDPGTWEEPKREVKAGLESSGAEPRFHMQSQPEEVPAAPLKVRTEPIKVPLGVGAVQTDRWSWLESVERLDGVIAAQIDQVNAVREAEGLQKEASVFALNIMGSAAQICSNCHQEGCQYMPINVRAQNPEIDLLEDTLIVYIEVASRLGLPFGIVVYDEDVVVLKEVNAPLETHDKVTLLEKYRAFKDRHDYPDRFDPNFLRAQRAQWREAKRTEVVAGTPDDVGMLNVSQHMLADLGGGALVLATSKKPVNSLKARTLMARKKGLNVSAMAFGHYAQDIARLIGGDSAVLDDAHQARTFVGDRLTQGLRE